jgi:TRAP-type C4-dicarboxylate transport system permease small subunit
MSVLSRLAKLIEIACHFFTAFGLIVLIGFAVLTLVNGIARSLLLAPLEIVGDLANLVVASAVASCFPLAILQKANIRIEIVLDLLPRGTRRMVVSIVNVLVLVMLIGVTRQLFVYAGNAARAGDCTAMLEIPTAPFWYYVAAMLAVATVTQVLLFAIEISGGVYRPSEPIPGPHG